MHFLLSVDRKRKTPETWRRDKTTIGSPAVKRIGVVMKNMTHGSLPEGYLSGLRHRRALTPRLLEATEGCIPIRAKFLKYGMVSIRDFDIDITNIEDEASMYGCLILIKIQEKYCCPPANGTAWNLPAR